MYSRDLRGADGLAHLLERPYDFDFVQAVALLQNHGTDEGAKALVGFDGSPEQEVVRFRTAATLRNNACQVISVEAVPGPNTGNYELTIPFLGLIGVNGVLPRHYTQLVITRTKEKDYAMQDFFDLFNHRILSMFFRASVKYRLPYVYQFNPGHAHGRDDPITQGLRCLVGLGDRRLKHKLSIDDETVLFYGGHFADKRPTAHSLRRIITDFIRIPARVLQFQFEWLYIDPQEQTRLSKTAQHRLGQDVVVGDRVPSFQSRFRIQVGPVSWPQFTDLLPVSRQVAKLADLVRLYVGISLDFDLQVTLQGSEIPPCILSDEQPPMLGWTTWLFSTPPEDEVVQDAVFDIGAI